MFAALMSLALLAATAQTPTTETELRVEREAAGYALKFDGEPALVLDRVRARPILVDRRFTRLERRGGTIELSADADPVLDLRLEVTRRGPDAWSVKLTAAAGIRGRLASIELPYRCAGDAADRIHLPRVSDDDREVATDASFACPLLVATHGTDSWAIAPDTTELARKRRMPWFLAERGGGRTLIHGLGHDGTVVELREEQLVLAHRLVHRAGLGHAAFVAELCREAWPPRVPELERPIGPLLKHAALDMARRIRRVPADRGFSVVPESAGGPQPAVVLQTQGRDHRPLAAALAAFAATTGTERDRARGVCRLFLSATERGGLFRTRARVDMKSGRVQWELDSQGCMSCQDAAETGLMFLRWAHADSVLRHACLKRVRRLAEFFASVERAGRIPARFTDRLIARNEPRPLLAEGLSDARLLLAAARVLGEPEWRRIAARIHDRTQRAGPSQWIDRSSAAHGPGALGARVLIDGALLAFGLADQLDAPARARDGVRWLEALLPYQQVWSRPGGFLRSNFDAVWSDSGCIEGAHALMRGFVATGESQLLARAAAALRASCRGDRRQLAETAPWIRGFADRWGDAVIDLESRTAAAFDACAIEDLRVATHGVAFKLTTLAAKTGDRYVRVKLWPPPERSMQLSCNGRSRGVRSAAALAAGVTLEPIPATVLRFEPPPRHDRRRDLEIRALVTGVPAQRIAATARVRSGAMDLELPMRTEAVTASRAWLHATLPQSRLSGVGFVDVDVRVEDRRDTITSPTRRITLGTRSVADCGDDDERRLTRAGASWIGPSPDGSGHARWIESGDSCVYRLPVDPHRLRVRLGFRTSGAGAVRIGTTRHVLPATANDAFRDSVLVLDDRQLWATGHVEIAFTATRGTAGVSYIEFDAEGFGTPANAIGRRITRRSDRRLRLDVLPLLTGGAARDHEEAIRNRVFGLTQSLKAWTERLSRKRWHLSGRVQPARPAHEPLGKEPSPDAILDAARATFPTAFAHAESDLLIVLHTSRPDGGYGIRDLGAERRAVLGPMRDANGRPIPVGAIARRCIEALGALPVATTRNGGALGPGVLLGCEPGAALAPPPLGLRMFRLGWAPIYEAATERKTAVVQPRIDRLGFVLALPHKGLVGRGRLLIEQRPGRRLLAYWDLPDAIVRLSSTRWPIRLSPRIAPLRPDHFHGLLAPVPAHAMPPPWPDIHTTHGETCWRITNAHAGANDDSARFDLVPLTTDMLRPGAGLTLASRAGPTTDFVPLALDAPATAAGHVTRRGHSLAIALPARTGGRIRASWPVAATTGRRLFGRIHGESVRMRVSVEARAGRSTLLDFRVDARSERFIATLPARQDAATLVIELEAAKPNARATIEALASCPLAPSVLDLFELAPEPYRRPGESASSDGVVRGPCLVVGSGERGAGGIDLPIAVPKSGAVLRIEAGFGIGAARGHRRRIDVSFRDSRGTAVEPLVAAAAIETGAAHLPLFLIDLAGLAGRTGFLLVSSPDQGPPIYLSLASIRSR